SQLLRITAESLGERRDSRVDQFVLVEIRHGLRLRTTEPAREYGKVSRMLRPPDRYRRIREQERQVGELASSFEPPTGLKAQQDLNDVSEADIPCGCGLLAFRRREHDLSEQRHRDGEDREITLIGLAAGAT